MTAEQREAALKGCLRRIPGDDAQPDTGTKPVAADNEEDFNDWVDGGVTDHAGEVLLCLCWDPACKVAGRPRFPVLELPMAADCSAQEMMMILGDVMASSGLGASVKLLWTYNSFRYAFPIVWS